MFAIQHEAILTRNYLQHIIKVPIILSNLCSLCGSSSETIQHVIHSCRKLAQITLKH